MVWASPKLLSAKTISSWSIAKTQFGLIASFCFLAKNCIWIQKKPKTFAYTVKTRLLKKCWINSSRTKKRTNLISSKWLSILLLLKSSLFLQMQFVICLWHQKPCLVLLASAILYNMLLFYQDSEKAYRNWCISYPIMKYIVPTYKTCLRIWICQIICIKVR